MDSNETTPDGARESLPVTASGQPAWAVPPVQQVPDGPPQAVPAVTPGAGPGPLMKGKLALVAGAVGLVAVGGIGGFVLGQSSSATAGTASDTGRFGGGPPGTTGGEGFSGQLPGGGVAGGPGTSTGTGTGSGTVGGTGTTGPTT